MQVVQYPSNRVGPHVHRYPLIRMLHKLTVALNTGDSQINQYSLKTRAVHGLFSIPQIAWLTTQPTILQLHGTQLNQVVPYIAWLTT